MSIVASIGGSGLNRSVVNHVYDSLLNDSIKIDKELSKYLLSKNIIFGD